jgi:hypothetical protein
MMTAMNESKANLSAVNQLVLKPSEPIVLTGELDLEQVHRIICRKASNNSNGCENSLPVYIEGLKGLDVASGWWTTLTSYYTTYTFYLSSSTLAFYYMGNGPGQYQCNETTIFKEVKSSGSFLNRLGTLLLQNSITYDQDNPVCPFLFANAQIDSLQINGLVNSFVVSNILKFQKLNSSSTTINSTITQLELNGYEYAVDELLLQHLVFEQVETLRIYGSIGSIQPDLFKSFFGQIYLVDIKVKFLANFYHQVGLEWTGHLSNVNNNISVSFSENSNGESNWLNPGYGYTYPNQDLCIFASFAFLQPQQRQLNSSSFVALVIPVIFFNATGIGCTDPAAWLTHDYKVYYEFSQVLSAGYHDDSLLSSYELCWNRSNALNLSVIEAKVNQCSSLSNGSQAHFKTYFEHCESAKWDFDSIPPIFFLPFLSGQNNACVSLNKYSCICK